MLLVHSFFGTKETRKEIFPAISTQGENNIVVEAGDETIVTNDMKFIGKDLDIVFVHSYNEFGWEVRVEKKIQIRKNE
jgi:hypothetical protein